MKHSHLAFRTILVATDLAENSSAALHYAQAMAASHSARLVIVHIIDPVGYAFPEGDPQFLLHNRETANELKKIEDAIRLRGIAVHSVIQSGAICDGILEAVHTHRADILILGTKSVSAVGKVALGTVARQLISRCGCPLLTVLPSANYQSSAAGGWRRILVATDFSEPSLAALECAQQLVRAQLFVLHVNQTENRELSSEWLEKLRLLAPMNESHTVPVEHFVEAGETANLVVEFAQRLKVDMVVLGSPSKALSTEELHSSTVLEIISHLDCPVLCFPREPAGPEPAYNPERDSSLVLSD